MIKTPKHVNGVEMVCENLNVIGTTDPKVCLVYINKFFCNIKFSNFLFICFRSKLYF